MFVRLRKFVDLSLSTLISLGAYADRCEDIYRMNF